MPSVAYVVSPHGFGHAARACALMGALWRLMPDLRFEVFTTVPKWFFEQSLRRSSYSASLRGRRGSAFRFHRLVTDVGLVQHTPMEEDLVATLRRVDRLLDPSSGVLDRLSDRFERLDCALVVCDIAPLGIAAAGRLGLPSVLVENFTWDWIYEGYAESCPELLPYAETLRRMSSAVELHIQAEPACRPNATALQVPPMSRPPRTAASAVRRRLGIADNEAMVMLTMGGLGWDYRAIDGLIDYPRARFVVPGGASSTRCDGGLILLPFRSSFFHPDLVNASDVVVGKLGYSTVAEAHFGRAAMAFIPRTRFRESAVLGRFVRATMASTEISEASFSSGSWLEDLDRLLGAPKPSEERRNGAMVAAEAIVERFGDRLG
jgi:hypothetical protein